MPKIGLWGSLTQFTDGASEVEVSGANVRDCLADLVVRYPGLKPFIEKGVAISINGQIHRDGWFVAIAEDDEVFLLPRLAGG
jgi:molybdopterin converting factor small subunit